MERLKQLIDLCKFYKIDTHRTYDRRHYDIETGKIPVEYAPDSVKARFPKQESYRVNDYELWIEPRQVCFTSWFEDHHNGNAHDIQKTLIDLTPEEFRAMIKNEEDYFETLLKGRLREIILQELVDARFQLIMKHI